MIFSFCDAAGQATLQLKGELFKYLIKVRRHSVGDVIALRSKSDTSQLYMYRLEAVDGRSASLVLQEAQTCEIKASRPLHLGWCVIDPKSVEKVLPILNEVGVAQITFITCKRSQKNFTPDLKRFERILEASSQQCGRSETMRFDHASSLEVFLQAHPEAKVLDFGGELLGDVMPQTAVIGCEGGFDDTERALFKDRSLRFDSQLVLRSESAAVAIASKVLL